jgi:hypothetical protein
MLPLFTATIFLSALLVFLVQPMAARLVLPLLGGSPAVWNTAMVFFQAVLLAGYGYAHLVGKLRTTRAKLLVHVPVLLLPLIVLPIARPGGWEPPTEGSPVWWLLGWLGVTVGLPFFVVSTTGPLLQRWFSGTDHPAAKDPYFLYAASNAGSLLALLGYPVLVEPLLTLRQQGAVWGWMYGAFALLAAGCGAAAARRGERKNGKAEQQKSDGRLPGLPSGEPAPTRLTIGVRVRWVFLAFVPSSLTLGVTQYLSTDIAAAPFLWVVPLSVYLLTFIVAFSRGPLGGERGVRLWSTLYKVLALVLAVTFLLQAREPILLLVVLHIGGLFVAGMLCHSRLAEQRPPTRDLTAFYLWIAVGGVLGGLFNAVVAPMIFGQVLEYPLAIGLACLALPLTVRARNPRAETPPARPVHTGPSGAKGRPNNAPGGADDAQSTLLGRFGTGRLLDIALPLGLMALVLLIQLTDHRLGVSPDAARVMEVGVPAFILYLLSTRPARFALAVGGVTVLSQVLFSGRSHVKLMERTFFGVCAVVEDVDENNQPFRHTLWHGTTVHGMQALDPARAGEPLTYYHRGSPAGQLFAALREDPHLDHVGAIGLGTGALATYGRPGQSFTFYEIDPAIARIAADPAYFTFLRDSRASHDVRLGDGRLQIGKASDGAYGLIVVDAFSSDAIPVHLITREAVALYLSKLSPHGLLLFHVSNRHVDLRPVLGSIARDLGLEARANIDLQAEDVRRSGILSSTWVALCRQPADLGALERDRRWAPVRPGGRTWTDDYSNLLGIFHWGEFQPVP